MVGMLTPRIRLTGSQREDLADICKVGSSALFQVASRIEAAPFTIRRSQIEKLISVEIGGAGSAALSRVLFGIASGFRRSHFSAEDALDGLTRSLAGDEQHAAWPECVPALRRILETKSLRLSAKALDVSYDFERVYLAGRLLTSVRPIFDDAREDIIGTTIVQTLRLEYIAPSGDQSSMSVALDLDDIKSLRDECEAAMRKAAVAQKRVSSDCGFEAIIPGEEQGE